MIEFIKVESLLSIRNDVLRDGRLSVNDCRFATDEIEGAFHLGFYQDNELACVVSFHPQQYGEFTGVGYQLRGMATIQKYRSRGLGNQLVNFALTYLRGQKINYVWCNARKKAVRFYQNTGFESVSEEFEVPGIGPHHVMYVKLQ